MPNYVLLDAAKATVVRTETQSFAPIGPDQELPWIETSNEAVAPGWTTADGGQTFVAPVSAAPTLASVQKSLADDVDRQAEAQRQIYITGGDGQMAVYLQKQMQAAGALNGLSATPPMTAAQGATAYVLLAAEVGITVDPSTKAPAVDVFGVARAVAAVIAVWLPAAAAIEEVRLETKKAIAAAATTAAAQAVHDAVIWPAAPAA